MNSKSKEATLNIKISQDIYSADPYQFDLHSHHIVFGSVFAKLFSSYKDAKITEYLAKSYTVDSGYKNWKFSIRSDVTFSNGDLITPKIIESSLKRIFLLAKKNKSNLPIVRKISGIENLTSLNSKISGFYSDDENIYFKLSEGEQNLPEILSFGLYGIAHPSDYDESTLEWKNSKPISSGPYYFKEVDFTKKNLQLFLRTDGFPIELVLENGPKAIRFSTEVNDNIQNFEISDGFLSQELDKLHFRFYGNTGADVFYLYVVKWDDLKDPLGHAENRKKLRYLLEKNLIKLKTTRSLFPLIHTGVREVDLDEEDISSIQSIFKNHDFYINTGSKLKNNDFNLIREALVTTIQSIGGNVIEINIPTSEASKHYRNDKISVPRLSFATRGTSIGNENPRETAEFMLSKEGINIPDPRGVLIKIAQSEPFDMNAFNKELYEDAILWPMIHTSFGYWAKDDLDFSRFNLSLPLSEVHWIGLK
ncbi:MAG: ABC transporter substrate-binding protein [Oligoflexia bacterium]|nr:ABC transporter substrate-binding protein [Oligoflexia bacterium]